MYVLKFMVHKNNWRAIIMAKSMYETIKRQNGEAFAQLIRREDSRIFNLENLPEILRYAGDDAKAIIPFLRGLIRMEEISGQEVEGTPFELLKQAGYDAFYVDTIEKKNSIEHYFYFHEGLCTFDDFLRHENFHIIHCIKEGADKLKREDFKDPKRQDEYGTSVISIQISKTGGFVSIKNRYNATVIDCDNTFDSNPDKIIKGLSASLEKYFNIELLAPKVELPRGYTYQNGCIYQFDYQQDNIYIGNGFYVKDGVVSKIQKDYQFTIGSYLFDLKEKTVKNLRYENDPHAQVMNEEMAGKKIQKRVVDGNTCVYLDGELFFKTKKVDGSSKEEYIDEITLSKARELPDGTSFGKLFKNVFVMRAPEVRKIGSNCLREVNFFDLPKLEETGDCCFSYGRMEGMDKIYFPHLRKIGNECFCDISPVREIILPELREAGDETFRCTSCATLLLPKLERVGSKSIAFNDNLTKIVAPSLKSMDKYSIVGNDKLESLYLLQLENMDISCIMNNKNLRKIVLPQLQRADKECFCGNKSDCYIEAPNLIQLERYVIGKRTRLNAPQLDKKVFKSLKVKKTNRDFNCLSYILSYIRRNERSIG